jgi:hypothetical protein
MPRIQRWGLSGASTSVSETTCRLSSTRSGGRGRLRHRARSISQVGRRSWAPKVHAGRPDACFPGQASAWGSRAHAIAWDDTQASRPALARLLLSPWQSSSLRSRHSDECSSSVALAGGAGVDALAYRRERQRARPRRLRRSSAAVRLRLARCLRVRNLVRRTLRFGPYSGPRARGPSTSMRRARSVVAHIGCAGFSGARCAGRAVTIVVLSLGIERWQ